MSSHIYNSSDRLRYHETDTGGEAGERAILYMFDSGRTAMLARKERLKGALQSGEIALRTESLEFERPSGRLLYDDEIIIETSLTIENNRMNFTYVLKSEDGIKIALGKSSHSLSKDGDEITELELENYMKEQSGD